MPEPACPARRDARPIAALALTLVAAATAGADPVTIVNDVSGVPPAYCQAQPPATCYYVDPVGGNDGNAGTFAQPWRTMVNFNQSIYSTYRPPTWVGLSPGDVVYLMEGVHDTIYHPGHDDGPDGGGSTIVWFQGLHGTPDAPILVRNYPGHHAILDPAGQGEGITVIYSSYIHIQGLEIRDAYNRGLLFNGADHSRANHLLIGDTDGEVGANVAAIEMAYSEDVELSHSILYDSYDRTAAQNGVNTHNIRAARNGRGCAPRRRHPTEAAQRDAAQAAATQRRAATWSCSTTRA